ncbi:MAG: endolytic transglycosylase MltG, partial [Acutalibacteraceae bacterium]
MDDKKKNDFGEDIDLDSLISYYSKNNEPSETKKDDLSFSKESIQQKSVGKKKFVVHIDEDELDYSSANDEPSDSSSVYFSNYPKRRPPQADKVSRTVQNPPAKKPQSAKKKKKSVGSRLAVFLFACIIFFTSVSSYLLISGINDILAINTSDVVDSVNIPEGSTYSDIIDILQDNKLIKRKLMCKLFAKFRDYDEYTYLSGVYYLDRSMGVEGMLNECRAAPESAETVTLGFPEGWTITQIFEKL